MVSHLRLSNTIVFWAMWNWNRYAKEHNKGQDLEIRVVHSHQISKEYPTPRKTALAYHLWPAKLDTNYNLMYCSVGRLWQATVRFARGSFFVVDAKRQIWLTMKYTSQLELFLSGGLRKHMQDDVTPTVVKVMYNFERFCDSGKE